MIVPHGHPPGHVRPPAWRRLVGLGRAATLAIALTTSGHGPEDEQINQLTAQLERHPQDLTARLRRGELLRDHPRPGDRHSLSVAREDFAYVLRINPNLLPAQLGMARVELVAGDFTNALSRLDRLRAGTNPIATIHLLRAEALMGCARPDDAVAAYTEALQQQKDPRAETYLARARAQLAASPTNYTATLAGLDAGLTRLGPVPGLQLMALDIALRAANYTSALERLDALAADSERRESWLARRGDVLSAAGRTAEAQAAWQQALRTCQELPERMRSSTAMRELQTDLNRKLTAQSAR